MTRMANAFPNYPSYPRQPAGGNLPPPPIGAPGLRPRESSPSYSRYAGTRGRALAGVNTMNAEPIKDYANELDLLQVADDVTGNGMFDPPGTQGNVHPDYGIFADHQSLPGYIDREMFYSASEVRDATTGQPVMYVPGGAVAIDEAQRQAFDDRLLWELPPGVNPWEPNPVNGRWTVTPQEAGWAVGSAEGESASPLKLFAIAAAAGLSIGMFAALVAQKGKR
jgi:hypothetical protein